MVNIRHGTALEAVSAGKNISILFPLPEARNWLADIRYEDQHGIVVTSSDMLVDEWFDNSSGLYYDGDDVESCSHE